MRPKHYSNYHTKTSKQEKTKLCLKKGMENGLERDKGQNYQHKIQTELLTYPLYNRTKIRIEEG